MTWAMERGSSSVQEATHLCVANMAVGLKQEPKMKPSWHAQLWFSVKKSAANCRRSRVELVHALLQGAGEFLSAAVLLHVHDLQLPWVTGPHCGWFRTIFESMVPVHCSSVFTGELFQGFLGGAGFRPSTVCSGWPMLTWLPVFRSLLKSEQLLVGTIITQPLNTKKPKS